MVLGLKVTLAPMSSHPERDATLRFDGRHAAAHPAPSKKARKSHGRDREEDIAKGLLRLTQEAGNTLSLREVVARICRLTVDLVPCDRCAIYLWNEQRDTIIPV